MKVKTFIEREKANKQELMELLNLTADDLFIKSFEGAYEYLENVFGTDAYGLKHLPNTTEFWTWWRMEWSKIDSVFLSALDFDLGDIHRKGLICKVRDRDNVNTYWYCYSTEHLLDAYDGYHQASMQNKYINSSIVHAGMHELINSITHKTKLAVNHG